MAGRLHLEEFEAPGLDRELATPGPISGSLRSRLNAADDLLHVLRERGEEAVGRYCLLACALGDYPRDATLARAAGLAAEVAGLGELEEAEAQRVVDDLFPQHGEGTDNIRLEVLVAARLFPGGRDESSPDANPCEPI